jgi:two-component system chemotaxis response regulator CheY
MSATDTASKRVLIVEDSPPMRRMVALTLKSVGIDVAEAEDGEVALQMACEQHFALLLIDINMPNLNGPALIRALRVHPDYRCTPLIVLTIESSIEKREKGIEAGATGWLVKPFDPEQLIAVVKRFLD